MGTFFLKGKLLIIEFVIGKKRILEKQQQFAGDFKKKKKRVNKGKLILSRLFPHYITLLYYKNQIRIK